MCKKRTSVSHSSTESEIISLDPALRMDGIPVDLWDVVMELVPASKNTHTHQAQGDLVRKEVRSTNPKSKFYRRSNRDVDEVSNLDHVVTNANSSHMKVSCICSRTEVVARGWVLKAWLQQAAADPRRTREPACVRAPFPRRWQTQKKNKLTSCRGLQLDALTLGGRPGCRKGKWSSRGTRTTVLTNPCPTASRVSVAVRGCARVTGKAGENGQYSAAGRQLTLDKTVGSWMW